MNISSVELNDLLYFPYYMKDRNKEIKKIPIHFKNIELIDNEILVSAICKNYFLKVLIQDNIVDLKSPIKVFCSCPSFNFEFAHLLYDNNALLDPDNFKKAVLRTPKEKNKHNVVCGCKHLVSFCNFIRNKSEIIDAKVEKIKKINKE